LLIFCNIARVTKRRNNADKKERHEELGPKSDCSLEEMEIKNHPKEIVHPEEGTGNKNALFVSCSISVS